MLRTFVLITLAVCLLGTDARAQALWIGGGSTPQGDYLRGLGIAAWGMGTYNYNTAVADSINADTFIKLNEYFAAVAKEQTREYVARKQMLAERTKEMSERERLRILENPEARDIEKGSALNAILEQLENARVDESTMRSAELQVPLPADVIRHIPFTLSEKGEKFSMDRLCLKGKGKWTVALQDDRFLLVKKAYERALDRALDQAIDGKMQISAIDGVEAAADDMFRRLDEVVGASPDRLYIEAKERLTELKSTVRLLKTEMVERAIGDIDKYSGMTVHELKLFMQTHHLRFASAQNPEERLLFPVLYASLIQQRDKLANLGALRVK